MQTRDLKEDKRREFYGVMLADSDRLLNTVEQVLQASRTREKNHLLNITEINLAELLRESIERIKTRYDFGIGIPSAQLKRIFKRFYRVPSLQMRKKKGTGLGLFIVRSIVKKHGGRIFAESKGEGLGSTFIVQLPKKVKSE
ncbi:MAG: sensor histidine kinase [Pyrinomonadaceae bacterium]